MKILHLFRNTPDALAEDMIEAQGDKNSITAVLIQEAALWTGNLPCDILTLEEALSEKPPRANRETIGYKDLLELIFKNDVVISW